jgi:2-keto-4-pentenoate hydratase/2-oxohepta-3-ene-1,7-dioic acid hydratase in catechol pathway
MRIASWNVDGAEHAVVHTDEGWVRVLDLLPGIRTVNDLIGGGEEDVETLQARLKAGQASVTLDPQACQVLPSVPHASNIIAIGRNYADHADEEAVAPPVRPELFLKHTSSLNADGAPIVWDPAYTSQVDWEAELGVVIGRTARNVPVPEALDYVFGYTVFNDISARDLQFGDAQWARGKSLEGFGPVGPWIVTRDEIADPQDLRISCRVNDAVVQEATTADMFFGVADIIAFCSRAFTLRSGDLIVTGTPGGVGAFRSPPVWLRDGDVVTVEVERVGVLSNTCLAPSRSLENNHPIR